MSKPTFIRAEGLDVITEDIDELDGTVKHTLVIYNTQFNSFCNQYANAKGVTRLEIVKRKTPSPKGHLHVCRVASSLTNKCFIDGVYPKPLNELK